MPKRTPTASTPASTMDARLLEQIVGCINSGVIAVDIEGRVALFNPSASIHLGLPPETLYIGARLEEIPGLDHLIELAEEVDHSRETIARREVVVPSEDSEIVLGVTVSPLLHEEGGASGKVFLFTDLTQIRALERHAELNAQLAQIGELTAGVVHELRNPLSVIGGIAELLQRRLQDDERAASNVALIVEEVGNLDRLIRDFLVFSKPYEIEKSVCEPETVATRAHKQVERLARDHGVTVSLQVSNALPRIAADVPKLVQAVSNLLRNAIEVSPPGGTVQFEARRDEGALVFSVADQGPGIDPHLADSIFNPFFSKKSGGTGLGLSIVHRIITGHGGEIIFRNLPSAGAVFEVRLPA